MKIVADDWCIVWVQRSPRKPTLYEGLDCIERRVQPIRDHYQIFIDGEIVKSGPVPKTTSKIPSDS